MPTRKVQRPILQHQVKQADAILIVFYDPNTIKVRKRPYVYEIAISIVSGDDM